MVQSGIEWPRGLYSLQLYSVIAKSVRYCFLNFCFYKNSCFRSLLLDIAIGSIVSHLNIRWYVGRLSRKQSEELLLERDSRGFLQPDGAFLVRQCESTPGDFSLSVKCALPLFCSAFASPSAVASASASLSLILCVRVSLSVHSAARRGSLLQNPLCFRNSSAI